MQPSLELEDFQLTRLHVDWVSGKTDKPSDVVQYRFGYDYDIAEHNEDDHKLRVRFRLEGFPNDNNPGYRLQTELSGYFTSATPVTSGLPLDAIVNACVILYGIIRGQLAMVTGSGPGNKLSLPTINMLEVVKQVQATENTSKKSIDRRPASTKPTPQRRRQPVKAKQSR